MTRSRVRARQDRPDAALLAGEGSILDPRGPWPWYVLLAAMLGLAVLLVLKGARARERAGWPGGKRIDQGCRFAQARGATYASHRGE
jgi:hypothetical protein